jgi:phosphohistidine phosphatase
MKMVFVIRHAKSSWDNTELTDFERPLNDRGKKDAPEMADRLLKKRFKIDAFISSTAKRARKTAKIFAEIFDMEKEPILLEESLYHASPAAFYSVIAGTSDEFNSIAIFSHNPGLTEFVNTLTVMKVDNVPTCGIFVASAPVNKWREFKEAKKEFVFFDFPKSANED